MLDKLCLISLAARKVISSSHIVLLFYLKKYSGISVNAIACSYIQYNDGLFDIFICYYGVDVTSNKYLHVQRTYFL